MKAKLLLPRPAGEGAVHIPTGGLKKVDISSLKIVETSYFLLLKFILLIELHKTYYKIMNLVQLLKNELRL